MTSIMLFVTYCCVGLCYCAVIVASTAGRGETLSAFCESERRTSAIIGEAEGGKNRLVLAFILREGLNMRKENTAPHNELSLL